jgi:uncharacterized protein (DUF1684 family)
MDTTATPATLDASYEQEIHAWRARRATNLQSDEGWLTVVGLHWLQEGPNTAGSVKNNDIVLPEHAPARIGVLILQNGAVRFDPNPKAGVRVSGQPARAMRLMADADGEPTILEVGSLRMHVIKRGNRYALRVKDRESRARKEFRGLEYYPLDPSWRVTARFEPYRPPKKIPIANIVGITEEMTTPGALVFERDGATYRIDPVLEEGSKELFVIFGDRTNGKETYGAGRYLYTSMPGADGRVIVDFNKAYNPPCVFTDFATCPLPPPQNKLPIPLTAGEKTYEH